jgi:hypothetical protein
MTKKSRREIERELDTVTDDEEQVENPILTITRTEEGVFDMNGEPVSQEELDRASVIFNLTSPAENYTPEG